MPAFEHSLVIAAALLLIAVMAGKASRRTGIPSLLLFLAIGMLAGSDGPGGLWFDNAFLAQAVGTIALTVILFAGGLETDWLAARPVLWQALSLATVGVAVTAALAGFFAHWLLGISLIEGLLIGAIVSSTDAAAVFSILRAQRLAFRGRLQALLELESGSNDPMAVFLAIGLTKLLTQPDTTFTELVSIFLLQMTVGAILGYLFGRLAVLAINRIRLETEGLYPVLMVGIVLFTYAATASLHGSGFLAAYIAGIVLGNREFVHKRSLSRFVDGMSWLVQIAMFLILGLLVFPSRLPAIAAASTGVALFLVFIARPASVFASLAFASIGVREKLLVSWVGLRGAVPIVLATFPLVAGVPRAELFFDLVFFVVLSSVLLQGTTIGPVARWLGLNKTEPVQSSPALEFVSPPNGANQLFEVNVTENSPAARKQLFEIRLPGSALAVLVTRGTQNIIPRGDTILRSGDRVLMLADPVDLSAVHSLLQGRTETTDSES